MQDKSLSRWRIVTLITTTVAFVFAVTYALTGYVVFGQQTEGRKEKKANYLIDNFCFLSSNQFKVIFWKIIVIGIR